MESVSVKPGCDSSESVFVIPVCVGINYVSACIYMNLCFLFLVCFYNTLVFYI